MKNWLHYKKIISKILTTNYSYNRFSLLFFYVKLLVLAFGNARFIRAKIHAPLLRKSLLGLSVKFQSYPELIQLFEEIFIFEIYKFQSQDQSPLIIDCGSNIGMSVLYFKMIYPQSHVIAFEPQEDNFKLLQQNLTINKIENVTTYKVALSNDQREVKLNSASSGSLNWTLASTQDLSAYELVEMDKLSRYLEKRDVSLLKIDIEGNEELVITDLIENNKLGLIKNLIIEYHPASTGHSPSMLMEILRKHKFSCEIKMGQTTTSEVLIYGKHI